MRIDCIANERDGLMAIVGFLCVCACVCVFAQVLGIPGILMDLLTASALLHGLLSDDAALGLVMPELEPSASSRIQAIVHPIRASFHFMHRVFHPPLA